MTDLLDNKRIIGPEKDTRPSPQTCKTRLTSAQQYFGKTFFSRKEYMQFHKDISSATASRDLLFGIKNKILRNLL